MRLWHCERIGLRINLRVKKQKQKKTERTRKYEHFDNEKLLEFRLQNFRLFGEKQQENGGYVI